MHLMLEQCTYARSLPQLTIILRTEGMSNTKQDAGPCNQICMKLYATSQKHQYIEEVPTAYRMHTRIGRSSPPQRAKCIQVVARFQRDMCTQEAGEFSKRNNDRLQIVHNQQPKSKAIWQEPV